MATESAPSATPGSSDVARLEVACLAPGSGARATVSVAADAPMREVARALADAVGVAVVGELLRPDGSPIPPEQSLAAAGVAAGETVLVTGIDDTPASRGGVLRRQLGGDAPGAPAGSPSPRRKELAPGSPTPVHSLRRRRRRAAAGTAVAAAVGFGAGALAFRSTGASTATGPDPVAVSAGSVWAGAVRRGASVRPVGWWASRGRRVVVMVVTGAGGGPFSLTAVTIAGVLDFPPTPGALPAAGGTAVPSVPDLWASHPTTDSLAADEWVAALFGPQGSETQLLDLGAGGEPRVEGSVATRSGERVERVGFTLTSGAPGTVTGRAAAARAAALESAVGRARLRLSGAQSALVRAMLRLAADRTAATSKQPVPAGAAPPGSAAAAGDGAAAAGTGVPAGAAGALRGDLAAVATDRSGVASAAAALGVAERAAAVPPPGGPARAVVNAHYDLLLVGGRVVGWTPAASET